MTKFLNVSISAALGVFGFLTASPNAFAAWHAEDTGIKVYPLATVTVDGGPVTIGWGPGGELDAVLYTGAWYSTPIYTNPGARALAVSASFIQTQPAVLDSIYVAHADNDGQLRLTSHDFLNGWKTLSQPIDAAVGWSGGSVATIVFQGKLYIFYSYPAAYNTLKCAIYDGNTATTKTLDGDGQLPGAVAGDMFQPTAVAAPDGLHVYYRDQTHRTLREAYSPDGVSWTRFQVIDGPGGYPGSTSDEVGFYPSAIVFSNGGATTINVFYTDATVLRMRTAQLLVGPLFSGLWQFGVVDPKAGLPNDSRYAAVIHGGGVQVYYTNDLGQISVAYGTGPGAFKLAALDGHGPGDLTSGNGGLQDPMGFYVTAAEVGGAPSVFYVDNITGTLRHANWQ